MSEDNGRETFGVLVTIEAKSGVTCIYGQHDFRNIIESGCLELGYSCKFSEIQTKIMVDRDEQYLTSIDIYSK